MAKAAEDRKRKIGIMQKSSLDNEKWYFKNYILVIGFLCIGPFILPLAWINPRFSLRTKSLITILIIAVTYILSIWTYSSIKLIQDYYKLLYSLTK